MLLPVPTVPPYDTLCTYGVKQLKLLGFSQRHLFGCSLMVREAGLEPARPEWTLEPESHYGHSPSVGAGLAAANPLPLCKSPHCYYLLTQTLA